MIKKYLTVDFWKLFVFVVLSLFLHITLFTQTAAHAKREEKEKKVSGQKKSLETSLGITPTFQALECQPGEKKVAVVTVVNANPNPMIVDIGIVGISLTSKGGLANFPLATLPSSNLSHHITVDSPQFDLPKNTKKDVNITINVPMGLTGTQYAAVQVTNWLSPFEAKKDEPQQRTEEYQKEVGVGLQPSMSSILQCDIIGTLKYGYVLQSVSLNLRGGELNAKAVYKNTGNAQLRFMPIMTILDMSNRVAGKIRGSNSLTLYPGGTQTAEFQPLYSNLAPGQYKVIVSIPDEKLNLPPQEKLVTLSR